MRSPRPPAVRRAAIEVATVYTTLEKAWDGSTLIESQLCSSSRGDAPFRGSGADSEADGVAALLAQ